MEELIMRLNLIPNAYFEFVDSVIDYAEEKESHYVLIKNYLDNNPCASPSDIIKLISSQPDFFDDDVPMEVDALVG